MALRSNIVRRFAGSKRYYARIGVPKDVQRHYRGSVPGRFKTELWRSLGTADPLEARTRAAPIIAAWHAEFADWRRRREPLDADLETIVWDHYQSELEIDRHERAANTGLISEWRERRIPELRKHLATGETALIQWAADAAIERLGLLIERGSRAYRELCQRLQRAELEYLVRASERDQGDFTGEPKDPIVTPPVHLTSKKNAAPGETIMELYVRFKSEKRGRVSADTWDQNEKIVRLFAEFVGETAHISAVNRKAIRDWKHKLASWPVKAAETNVFKGMSFKKVIEKNESEKKPTISQKTVNKYLSAVGSFAEWLLSNDFIEQDVMRGMYLTLDKSKKLVFPYSIEQLNLIFACPLFSKCAGDGAEHKPGNIAIRDWRYWIPLVALFTGARLGEIAQMNVADVRKLHDVWVFHVTSEGEGEKTTKTEGSQRVLPVHSKLVELGFIRRVEAMKRRKALRLFPEIERDKRGFYSGVPSGFFNDLFKHVGVKVDRRHNFHSFRHTVTDAFRRGGYLDEQFGMLLGHVKGSTTGRYGIMPQGPLSERVNMIEAVSYPGLVLPLPE
jgi:integrase